jgi:CRP-like cAMP-binding protein
MNLSKLKKIWKNVHSTYKITDKNKQLITNKNYLKFLAEEECQMISKFLVEKFPEASKMFEKFSQEDIFNFILLSNISEYKEGSIIFSRETQCKSYIFILNGIIYRDKDNSLKEGNIYGQMIKDKFKYDIKAQSDIELITIIKEDFDKIIYNINRRTKLFKINFIKKNFPDIRNFPENIYQEILSFFDRMQYKKYDKILIKGNYNEYIYLIISGQVAICQNSEIISTTFSIYDYIILEKLGRGDLIGINSALKGGKNLYTHIVITDEVELYRISKSDYTFYFRREFDDYSSGIISIEDLQEISCNKKIEFLKNSKNEDFSKFGIKIATQNITDDKPGIIVYEEQIRNTLHEKWKMGNFDMSEFHNKLLGEKKKRIEEAKISHYENNVNNNNSFKIQKFNPLYFVNNGKLNLKKKKKEKNKQ